MKELKRAPRPKRKKPQGGKKLVVPGQAAEVRNLFESFASGFPLPSARMELDFDVELNEITEDAFDMVDLEQYARLDPTEQIYAKQNLLGLKQSLISKLDRRHAEYLEAEAEPEIPVPPEPAPPTT